MSSEVILKTQRERDFEQNKRSIDEIGGVKIFKTNSHLPSSAKFIGVSTIGVVFSDNSASIDGQVQFLDFVQRSARGKL